MYIYILRSKTVGRYYIVQTQNLSERLSRHNSGQEKSTKPYVPWEMIYSEECKDRSTAMKLERKLKGMKSRKWIEAYIANNQGN